MSNETNQQARISTIGGDRLCTRCGFNLFGQPVQKDAGTGLMVSRCPECGAAAALQEYPGPFRALKWISGALIAVWLLMVLGLIAGTTAIMMGTTVGTREMTVEETGSEIAKRHKDWFDKTKQDAELQKQVDAGTLSLAAKQTILQQIQVGNWALVSDTWWQTVDQQEIVRWPWKGGNEHVAQTALLGAFLGLGLLCCGMALATAMPGMRGKRFLLVVIVTCGLACLGYEMVVLTTRIAGWRPTPGFVTAREHAYRTVPAAVGFLMIAMQGAVLLVGLFIGRKIARWIVKGTLPPRLARQLHVLWEADNLSFQDTK